MVILEGRLISGSARWMVIPLGKLIPGIGSFLSIRLRINARTKKRVKKCLQNIYTILT